LKHYGQAACSNSVVGVCLQQSVKQAYFEMAFGINPHLVLQTGEQPTCNSADATLDLQQYS